jgi:DNA replication protein DnaC
MLNHPTMDKLQELKLFGMLTALREQMQVPDCAALSFDERFGLLVDREATERENRRLASRLKRAKLRQAATVEDIDYRHPRGLDKSVMMSMASCQWIRKRHNCIITGPTGAGKSYIACALAHKACRDGFSVLYLRVPRMLHELAAARADGRYPRLLNSYAKTNLLVLDDWGLSPLTDEQRKDLFEILEDRYDIHSTLVTSQLPISKWHQVIGDPSVADALLDRLVHNAHKLTLKGESMRKKHRHVED